MVASNSSIWFQKLFFSQMPLSFGKSDWWKQSEKLHGKFLRFLCAVGPSLWNSILSAKNICVGHGQWLLRFHVLNERENIEVLCRPDQVSISENLNSLNNVQYGIEARSKFQRAAKHAIVTTITLRELNSMEYITSPFSIWLDRRKDWADFGHWVSTGSYLVRANNRK